MHTPGPIGRPLAPARVTALSSRQGVRRVQRAAGNRATRALLQRTCQCAGRNDCSVIEPEPVFRQHPELQSFVPPPDPVAVSRTDVVQGAIAACPIAAVMVATAHARPGRIRALLGPQRPGIALSKRADDEIFRFWSDVTYCVTFTGGGDHTVTPVVYFDGADVTYASTPTGPGWPSLIEKAYAIFRGSNSYARLDKGTTLTPVPDARTVLGDVVGPSDMAHIASDRLFTANATDRALTDADLIAMARRATTRPTIAASVAAGAVAPVISDHGYAVLRWDGRRVVLRNPWGGAGAEFALTISELKASFQAVLQAV